MWGTLQERAEHPPTKKSQLAAVAQRPALINLLFVGFVRSVEAQTPAWGWEVAGGCRVLGMLDGALDLTGVGRGSKQQGKLPSK